ncbi:hypothetical protein E4U55_005121 [Claviceps digitariae]|nr:hypothetical protein E4U55_005121 [Claviceps digitariae]
MPAHLLDLPVDIIALILRPLLVQAHPIPLCPCGHLPSSSSTTTTTSLTLDALLPILLIHPAIHAIAAPLFYQGNAFVLDLRGKHGPHVRRCLDELAEDEAAHADPSRYLDGPEDDGMLCRRRDLLAMRSALRRIRCLEVRIVKLRGWIENQIVPLVKDMTVSGGLAELYVKIYAASVCASAPSPAPTPAPAVAVAVASKSSVPAGPAGRASLSTSRPPGELDAAMDASHSIFTRPPLAGLLAALSDPYLRTARLWVSGTAAHEAWQPFRMPRSVGASRAGEADGDLVEIDWGSIMRVLDPEGRDKAVMISW